LENTFSQRTYVHVDVLPTLPEEARKLVNHAEDFTKLRRGEHFNVIRFANDGSYLSLLDYGGFFEDPFPELRQSWAVDLAKAEVTYRTYSDSLNPPILHRKELLIPSSHPRHEEYAALTAAARANWAIRNATRIGFKQQWVELLYSKGYRIVGHQFVPLANDDSIPVNSASPESPSVARHLTALVRYAFSAPIQALARYGFLERGVSVFDYGCGHGDDVRGLRENGYKPLDGILTLPPKTRLKKPSSSISVS